MAGAGHLPSFKAFAKRVEDRPSRPAVRQPDVGGLGAGSRSGAAPPRPRAHSGDRLGGATEDELAIWMRDATSGLTLRPRGTVDAPKAARIALAATSAIALADGSIVTLALPQLRGALDTGVEGVAAVLVIYCAALAIALALAIPLERRWGVARVGIAGLTLLAAGSLLCAAAGSLPVLLAARTVQAAGAAAALLLSFSYLREQPHLWRQTALLGTAVGPALGGALTQAFSWPSGSDRDRRSTPVPPARARRKCRGFTRARARARARRGTTGAPDPGPAGTRGDGGIAERRAVPARVAAGGRRRGLAPARRG
ncbi:MAG: MFS transporter [Solirubrobacteraceae bacterium]